MFFNNLIWYSCEHFPSLLHRWEKVVVTNCFHFSPLLYYLWTKFFLTLRTQINNFSSMRIAVKTIVVEKNIYFKIFIKNFTFIFADVLWTQLHFTCTNIVSILNVCSVEHYSANHCFTEALVIKNNLCVTSHSKGISLFFR